MAGSREDCKEYEQLEVTSGKGNDIRTVSEVVRSNLGVRICSLWLLLYFVFSHRLEAQPGEPPASPFLMEGEELVYNVRYAFINLGQVRIRTLRKVDTPEYAGYMSKAYIDSYSGVPFADLHATFESMMDTSVYSHGFTGKTKDGSYWHYARYNFEYDKQRVLIESGTRDTIIEKRDTLGLERQIQDGLSLFFYARKHVRSGMRMNIPAIVKEQKVNTYIDFKNKRESVEVDAIDYPVDVVEFEGNAEFVGIFGLTGDFEGWFSNDEARIPIVAKMKVIIGSVTLELMEWKRQGWIPPRGVED